MLSYFKNNDFNSTKESEKLELKFHNYYKKVLVTMDITKYSQDVS